jgi:beta-N-acetylhexosaminidase
MTTLDPAVKEALGNIIIGGFEKETIDDRFEQLLRKGMVGGAILFRRNINSIEQVADLVRSLREIRSDVWLAIDQEGGRVQRLGEPFPQLPPMRQIDTCEQASRVATLLAQGLNLLGFDQDYAPVLDVDTNPDNPVIGDRSFSSEADRVAELGCTFIQALQSAGIAACGKHFPGHGDTNTDSHLELPRLEHDLQRLQSVELVPFRAATQVGLASLMTAHVLFAPLDEEHPATLSRHFIEPILRREMAYDGVVVSDDLEMKAVADHYGIEEATVRALNAGCDQVLICSDTDLQAQAYEAIIHGLEKGTIKPERIHEAGRRIQIMKDRYQPLSAKLNGLGQALS